MRFGRSNASREELPILPVPNNENESYMMESITTTKKCSVCGRELPVEEFYKSKRCKDGLMPFCKECHHRGFETRKDAFADWKATNELYECLLKYYSR